MGAKSASLSSACEDHAPTTTVPETPSILPTPPTLIPSASTCSATPKTVLPQYFEAATTSTETLDDPPADTTSPPDDTTSPPASIVTFRRVYQRKDGVNIFALQQDDSKTPFWLGTREEYIAMMYFVCGALGFPKTVASDKRQRGDCLRCTTPMLKIEHYEACAELTAAISLLREEDEAPAGCIDFFSFLMRTQRSGFFNVIRISSHVADVDWALYEWKLELSSALKSYYLPLFVGAIEANILDKLAANKELMTNDEEQWIRPLQNFVLGLTSWYTTGHVRTQEHLLERGPGESVFCATWWTKHSRTP